MRAFFHFGVSHCFCVCQKVETRAGTTLCGVFEAEKSQCAGFVLGTLLRGGVELIEHAPFLVRQSDQHWRRVLVSS